MGKGTAISWTHRKRPDGSYMRGYTWNYLIGCSHVDAACSHCYAETLALRRGWTPLPWTHNNAGVNVLLKGAKLADPFGYEPHSFVFVNSLSDVWHEKVPADANRAAFAVMRLCPDLTFLILTKRPERCVDWPGPWTPNIWQGATVAERRNLGRLDALRACGAQTTFLSCEPLLEPLGSFDLSGISWVIAGGESGGHLAQPTYKDRWMRHAWARELRDTCAAQGVPFFFKQSSGLTTEMGRALEEDDGRRLVYEQFPDLLVPPWEADASRPPSPPPYPLDTAPVIHNARHKTVPTMRYLWDNEQGTVTERG